MPKCIDLTGQRFGMLTVIHKTTELEDRYAVWICQCDCGGTCRVNTKRLKRGTIANCGCIPQTTLQSGPVAADLSGMVFGNLTVLYRTKNTRNNKSSCIAEWRAVLVLWTHPEKRRYPARFQMLW